MPPRTSYWPWARRERLGGLRDKLRDLALAGADVDELHRRQHGARYFRHWRDSLGMVCFAGALPPEAGVGLVHRVEAAAQRLRREAGPGREGFEAHLADALAALGTGGPGRGARAELVMVCDVAAFQRGQAEAGEVCHVLDGGPVPVAVARRLAESAFIKAVLHDGVAVQAVAHFGRHLPAELRTALDIGGPPRFQGAVCADCGRRYGLEYDHVDPLAHHGPTSLANLEPRCWPDHQAKTERDRQAGLLGPGPLPNPARARAGPELEATKT